MWVGWFESHVELEKKEKKSCCSYFIFDQLILAQYSSSTQSWGSVLFPIAEMGNQGAIP